VDLNPQTPLGTPLSLGEHFPTFRRYTVISSSGSRISIRLKTKATSFYLFYLLNLLLIKWEKVVLYPVKQPNHISLN